MVLLKKLFMELLTTEVPLEPLLVGSLFGVPDDDVSLELLVGELADSVLKLDILAVEELNVVPLEMLLDILVELLDELMDRLLDALLGGSLLKLRDELVIKLRVDVLWTQEC